GTAERVAARGQAEADHAAPAGEALVDVHRPDAGREQDALGPGPAEDAVLLYQQFKRRGWL
ncbi:hypothetical protein, partial [Streptomyces sp. NPDC048191]|uniref:hypothetical protein n=1 Tax=Streptomyces sp. NPDC048191 TaxID=3155484 RepID=UPI0033E04DED